MEDEEVYLLMSRFRKVYNYLHGYKLKFYNITGNKLSVGRLEYTGDH